jgi:hypothetical protein
MDLAGTRTVPAISAGGLIQFIREGVPGEKANGIEAKFSVDT